MDTSVRFIGVREVDGTPFNKARLMMEVLDDSDKGATLTADIELRVPNSITTLPEIKKYALDQVKLLLAQLGSAPYQT